MTHAVTPLSLKQLAGLAPLVQISPSRTALLLIDYQREYLDGALPLAEVAAAIAQASRLRQWAVAAGIGRIHIHHHAKSASAALFAPGSSAAAPIEALTPASGEACLIKHLPSAFAGTDLAEHLQKAGVDTLLIAGCMTHNCVDATARDAFHRGYRVAVISDASATRDLPLPGGGIVAAATVQQATLAALADRMVEVFTVAELAALLGGKGGTD